MNTNCFGMSLDHCFCLLEMFSGISGLDPLSEQAYLLGVGAKSATGAALMLPVTKEQDTLLPSLGLENEDEDNPVGSASYNDLCSHLTTYTAEYADNDVCFIGSLVLAGSGDKEIGKEDI